MPLLELTLYLISVVFFVGGMFYMYFRARMSSNIVEHKNGYSRTRVVRLTVINILLIVSASLAFCLLFVEVVQFLVPTNPGGFLLSFLYFCSIGLSYYGAGIYITSIVLEAYTLSGLKHSNSYKTQAIATHLFHGPISHVLIYSGLISALFVLSLIEHLLNMSASIHFPILLYVVSFSTGLFFAITQINNHTYKYQFLTAAICLITFLLLTVFGAPYSSRGIIESYYIFFSGGVLLGIQGYLVTLYIKRRRGFTPTP